jgi:hypothetical protein
MESHICNRPPDPLRRDQSNLKDMFPELAKGSGSEMLVAPQNTRPA